MLVQSTRRKEQQLKAEKMLKGPGEKSKEVRTVVQLITDTINRGLELESLCVFIHLFQMNKSIPFSSLNTSLFVCAGYGPDGGPKRLGIPAQTYDLLQQGSKCSLSPRRMAKTLLWDSANVAFGIRR